MKRGIFYLFLFFWLISLASALGISPAKQEIDFSPGAEYEFIYNIFTESEDSLIKIEIAGDLAEFAFPSKSEVKGSGSFSLKVKLPDKIEQPGFHTIGVQVREVSASEGVIATSVAIHSNIKIFVSYPGKYAELSLSVSDGNIDSEIPVNVKIINRGSERVVTDLKIDFLTQNWEFVYKMPFTSKIIEPNGESSFSSSLNTSGYKAGNYFAEAILDFGEIVKANQTFRIGSLFVNVTNFTTQLSKNGIQKFFIDIESLWNENLDEVYADINISNDIDNLEFRTPSIDLKAWQRGQLVGFVDTEKLDGEYQTKIILSYAEANTVSYGSLLVLKPINMLLFFSIFAAVLILLIVVIVFLRKYKNKKIKEYKKTVKNSYKKK